MTNEQIIFNERIILMDDGIIGSGANDNSYEDLAAIPDSGERDDWWRLVIYTTKTSPDSPVVSIRSLKTLNGQTEELSANYSRKFIFSQASSSSIALWAKNGDCQFKNFVLSYQD